MYWANQCLQVLSPDPADQSGFTWHDPCSQSIFLLAHVFQTNTYLKWLLQQHQKTGSHLQQQHPWCFLQAWKDCRQSPQCYQHLDLQQVFMFVNAICKCLELTFYCLFVAIYIQYTIITIINRYQQCCPHGSSQIKAWFCNCPSVIGSLSEPE